MERAVGEIFEFEGVKLQVKDIGYRANCSGCSLLWVCYGCLSDRKNTDCIGNCNGLFRSDGISVIFVEV